MERVDTGASETVIDPLTGEEVTITAPVETELELRRTFSQPGKTYEVRMTAENMHMEGDIATMTW